MLQVIYFYKNQFNSMQPDTLEQFQQARWTGSPVVFGNAYMNAELEMNGLAALQYETWFSLFNA